MRDTNRGVTRRIGEAGRAGQMEKDDFSRRLAALENRIKASGSSGAGSKGGARGKYTQGSLAWRMVIELVVGMLLGLGIGYGLDSLFGTMPVLLVVFAMLGFAAGVKTMLRTAAEVKEGRGEAALIRDGERGDPRDRDGTGNGPRDG
jgi:ATP synthase protein I